MEAKETIFVETFGATPYIKVLGFFLTFDRFDYSKSQVADEVGISRITIEGIWRELVSKGMIKKTRVVGRAVLYALDKDNPLVGVLLEENYRLAKAYADELGKEKIAVKARSK